MLKSYFQQKIFVFFDNEAFRFLHRGKMKLKLVLRKNPITVEVGIEPL